MELMMGVCWIGVLLYIITANIFLYGHFRQFMSRRTTPAYTLIVNEIFSFFIVAGLVYIFLFRGLIGFLLSYMLWGNRYHWLHNEFTGLIDIGAIIFTTVFCLWTARRISRKYDRELTS